MKKKQEDELDLVAKLTESWREFLEVYNLLKEKHEQFCRDAVGVHLDLADPGTQVALQLKIHQRRFAMALEDILHQEYVKGDLRHLTPPVPQEKQEEQPKEPEKPKEEKKTMPPKSFKGKKKDSPTEE